MVCEVCESMRNVCESIRNQCEKLFFMLCLCVWRLFKTFMIYQFLVCEICEIFSAIYVSVSLTSHMGFAYSHTFTNCRKSVYLDVMSVENASCMRRC